MAIFSEIQHSTNSARFAFSFDILVYISCCEYILATLCIARSVYLLLFERKTIFERAKRKKTVVMFKCEFHFFYCSSLALSLSLAICLFLFFGCFACLHNLFSLIWCSFLCRRVMGHDEMLLMLF